MTYQVVINKKAFKILEEINEPDYSAIKKAIYALADNPRPHGYKKLKDRAGYRIRVGEYRIIYEILDKILLVDVIDVGHRKDIYD
jgi:mRNA interferase RelE/StbE